MNKYRHLIQEKADLAKELRAIADRVQNGEKLTDQEKADREAKFVRIEEVGHEIEQEERLQAYERSIVEPVTDVNQVVDPARAAAAVEPQGFSSFGEMLQATYRASVPHAPQLDPRLRIFTDGMPVKAGPTGLGETITSDGGFLVDKQRSTTIERRMYEIGEILQRCRQQPIGAGFNGYKGLTIDETSRANGSRWGGVQGYWASEAEAFTASKPKFAKFELELVKVIGLAYVTDELLADATALEATVNDALPEELTFKVEDAVLNGVGGGQPTGVIGSGAAVSVAKEAGQAPATILAENVEKMWSRMWGRSRRNMIWTVDQSAEPQLFKMSHVVGTGGIPVYLPAGGLSASPFSVLFQRPVVPIEYGAAVGTKGDIMALDLSQYMLITKGGVETASSMHVRFLYDEMAFRFVYRVNGKSLWRAPLTPKSGGPTLSPFVTLDTRA